MPRRNEKQSLRNFFFFGGFGGGGGGSNKVRYGKCESGVFSSFSFLLTAE